MRVLLAHPGIQHALRLARELERTGRLGEFWTGLALAEDGWAAQVVTRLRRLPRMKGLSNRIVRGVPPAKLHCLPGNEIRALMKLSRGGDGLRILHERNERFQDAIPAARLAASDAVIGFDTSAWRLAERIRAPGKPLYLDRTIAHPAAFARIEQDLHRRYPDWCPRPDPRPDYLVAAEAAEHSLAHRIVVGGSFARDTLVAEGIPADKVVVNPYGVDWAKFAGAPASDRSRRPFRFLFLGSHLARKGLPVLLDAWRALGDRRGDAELWLAGHCGERERALIPDLPGLKVRGLVPHADVPALLGEIDVFVLPSFFEGFGLVLLEALAAGVPYLSTAHTGAVDLPANPALGRIVPVGSVEALRAALEQSLAQPPDRAAVRAAVRLLEPDFSWTAYGDRWAALLRSS